MMQKALAVLACLVVSTSADQAFPTQCVINCGMSVYTMYKAGIALNAAIPACVGANTTRPGCLIDLGVAVTAVGNTSTYITQAVSTCGGSENQCSLDVSAALIDVGVALTATGTANVTCAKGILYAVQCALATTQAAVAVARATLSVNKARTSCGSGDLPEPATACGKQLAALRTDVANAGSPLTFAHVNATAAACGPCFDASLVSSAVATKQWDNALAAVVVSGAMC